MIRPKYSTVAKTLALVAALAIPALADIVHMKDGKKIEGKITSQTGDVVKITTKFGPMDLQKAKIDHIENVRMPDEEVDFRIGEAKGDPAKLWDAALYAKEKKLTKRYKDVAALVLKGDPQHAEANKVLGNVEYEGKWYTPENLELHKSKEAAEMKAKGKEYVDGLWMDHDAAMVRRGFEKYEGEWLRTAEVYRKKSELLAPKLLGATLETTDSEHFTMRSTLPTEGRRDLHDMLEATYDHFVSVFKPNEIERKMLDVYPIAVYVLPDRNMVAKFVEEGGYMNQMYTPPKGINERYLSVTSFPVFFPRPLIVAAMGDHLVGEADASLRGFLANFCGEILIRRFKRGGAVPGWVETGLAHYYEAKMNNYQTLSIIDYAWQEGDAQIDRWGDMASFNEWYAAASRPDFRASLPPFEHLRQRQVEEIDSRGLLKAYFMVRWLMETDPDRFVAYARRCFEQQNIVTKTVVSEANAFEEIFKTSSEEMDARFNAWLAQTPSAPPPF